MERSDQKQGSSCGECARLAAERMTALVAGDRSRQVDIRILTGRHSDQAHRTAKEVVS